MTESKARPDRLDGPPEVREILRAARKEDVASYGICKLDAHNVPTRDLAVMTIITRHLARIAFVSTRFYSGGRKRTPCGILCPAGTKIAAKGERPGEFCGGDYSSGELLCSARNTGSKARARRRIPALRPAQTTRESRRVVNGRFKCRGRVGPRRERGRSCTSTSTCSLETRSRGRAASYLRNSPPRSAEVSL